MTIVHSHFDGRSDDLNLDTLFPEGGNALESQVEATTRGVVEASSMIATTVKEALADHYDRPIAEFSEYDVIMETTGNISVRPKAEFGA